MAQAERRKYPKKAPPRTKTAPGAKVGEPLKAHLLPKGGKMDILRVRAEKNATLRVAGHSRKQRKLLLQLQKLHGGSLKYMQKRAQLAHHDARIARVSRLAGYMTTGKEGG